MANRGYLGNSGGGDSKIKRLASTAGKWWSETLDQLLSTVGTEERKVRTAPLSYKRKVVFFGSSSTEGTGTTTRDKYYGKLFEAKLAPLGYQFYHRGIGGDNTPGAINRFFKDIAPINADFLFIAFTIGNEGIYTATDKVATYEQFKKGIYQLCFMARQQGITPIIFTQAPTQSYNATYYDFYKKLNEEFSASDFHVVDWGGVLDDLAGKPMTPVVYDTLHYNDKGHTEICNAIPPTIFDKAGVQPGGYLSTLEGNIFTGNLATLTPIVYEPTDITTFTYSMRFKKSILELTGVVSFNVTDRVILEADGRLRYNNGVTTDIDGTVNYADGQWHTLTVTYSPVDLQLRFYVDGVFKKSFTNITLVPSKITVGGRDGATAVLKNAEIKDLVLYRTRLRDDQVLQVHEGVISQTSLEIFSPCHDKVVSGNTALINLAPTTVNFRVNSAETALLSVSPTM